MKNTFSFVVSLALLLFATGAVAHHSRSTFYDLSKHIELEGVVTRVQWRHPHVRYWLQADAQYGGEVWELETTPPSILEREGISADILAAGTRIRVAGAPARVAENAMEASQVLLPDGREVLLHRGLTPLWTNNVVMRDLQAPIDPAAVRAAQAAAKGIFRVWTRVFPNPDPLWRDVSEYPLTPQAGALAAAWDPIADIDTECAGKDMPAIMGTIWPMEFIDEGSQIRLLAEENDRVRIIDMTESAPDAAPSPMGYSVGRWDDDGALVVHTSGISSRLLGGTQGVPLSGNSETVERFALSADKGSLNYTLTVTDPDTFTEPVTLTSFWNWRPGIEVKKFDCVETPGSWTGQSEKQPLQN